MDKKEKAAPEVPAQEQPILKVKITNVDEFKSLIKELNELIKKLQQFKFKTKFTK